MPFAFDALLASSECTAMAGGIRWRLRVPSTRDLLHAGGVGVLAAVPSGDAVPALEGAAQGAAMLAQVDAMLCASVVAAGDGDTLEPLTLVGSIGAESRELSRVWVERVPPTTRMELMTALAGLLADGGRLEAAAATFRGPA